MINWEKMWGSSSELHQDLIQYFSGVTKTRSPAMLDNLQAAICMSFSSNIFAFWHSVNLIWCTLTCKWQWAIQSTQAHSVLDIAGVRDTCTHTHALSLSMLAWIKTSVTCCSLCITCQSKGCINIKNNFDRDRMAAEYRASPALWPTSLSHGTISFQTSDSRDSHSTATITSGVEGCHYPIQNHSNSSTKNIPVTEL
jgi:hypothetical protein